MLWLLSLRADEQGKGVSPIALMSDVLWLVCFAASIIKAGDAIASQAANAYSY